MKRESNIELLRIIAMLLVVLLHANYFSLGRVEISNLEAVTPQLFIKAFAEQLCIISVNVFILISGWFGIRPNLKGGLSLLYQVAFFHLLIILLLFSLEETISISSIILGFYLGALYWFVVAYLILYAIAPVLNAFTETANAKLHLSVIALFFFLEFSYGWIYSYGHFGNGYSAISFIGLYLLARFLYKYSSKIKIFNLTTSKNLLLYLFFSIIPVILLFITKHDFGTINYSSPFVILASVFFFLAFTKLHFSSKAINHISVSTFSIYLIHCHPLIAPHFKELMRNAYDFLGGGLYMLFAIIFATCYGFCCVVLDKARIWTWNLLCKHLLNSILSQFNNLIDKLFTRIGL